VKSEAESVKNLLRRFLEGSRHFLGIFQAAVTCICTTALSAVVHPRSLSQMFWKRNWKTSVVFERKAASDQPKKRKSAWANHYVDDDDDDDDAAADNANGREDDGSDSDDDDEEDEDDEEEEDERPRSLVMRRGVALYSTTSRGSRPNCFGKKVFRQIVPHMPHEVPVSRYTDDEFNAAVALYRENLVYDKEVLTGQTIKGLMMMTQRNPKKLFQRFLML